MWYVGLGSPPQEGAVLGVIPRQTAHTHCASVHQAAKLVAALLRVARVTAGLAESNGCLPSELFMTYVTCRLTAKNWDQLLNPTLGNRVWATFAFFLGNVSLESEMMKYCNRPQALYCVVLYCHSQELLDVELRSLIASGQVTVSHCRLFTYQLLTALRFAHTAGIIHCGLKPSNVLVNCQDLVLKLADFQFARLASPPPEPGKLSAVTAAFCFDLFHMFVYYNTRCLQCFDAVGWAAGRASGL